ncbi:YecA family protein [Deinococcus sp. SL84]|uniref:YecA family protein n=1 Tax=Deinococcus sp. SL84 TaxID=2994663 RepID=UPI002275F384|nr:SEC-C domain-containing protein [Deinococcus sp. SL84]MCY1702758.1 SEC-C domain-containing protein [Deinococcus sp. SL84]
MKLEFDRTETPAEVQLREWAEAQQGGVSYARIHGALHGVIATSMQGSDLGRSALRLLRLDAPDEVHALAVQAAQELHALEAGSGNADAEALLTVPRLTEHGVFLEWLGGVGAVALAQPDAVLEVLASCMTARQKPELFFRGGRGREEGEVMNDLAQDLLLMMALMPPEFLPAHFPPQAQDIFADIRRQTADPAEWDEEGRQETVLDVLGGVHAAYMTHAAMRQLQVQRLLDGDEWDGGEDEWALMPKRRESRKIRPNEPCPCGSGKKYKKCHGAPGAPTLEPALEEG